MKEYEHAPPTKILKQSDLFNRPRTALTDLSLVVVATPQYPLLQWLFTWKGILITVYMLNIIAWGGMLFLLLVNAVPSYTKPYGPDDNRSLRKIWIEIDSQILNGLFCFMGIGLLPWRLRDFYQLYADRVKLENRNSDWYVRANQSEIPSTKRWKLDAVVLLYMANSVFQILMAGFMWGYNRYNRPGAAVGIFVAIACGVSMAAGAIAGLEKRRVKKIKAEDTT